MARVLLACATSGVALDEFLALGHDAWQCDLLPAEQDRHKNRHIIGDVREVVRIIRPELMLVSNPPCTRLCFSGLRWLFGPGKTHPKVLPNGRTWEDMIAEYMLCVDIFQACLDAPVPLIGIENPKMHKYAKEDIRGLPEPQIIQPWQFGEPCFKATGLFLKGLDPLRPTNVLTPPSYGTAEYRAWAKIHRMPPGPNRQRDRSRTFEGIAAAWARQWGDQADRLAA